MAMYNQMSVVMDITVSTTTPLQTDVTVYMTLITSAITQLLLFFFLSNIRETS
jgi:hypothetical protein